MFLKFRYGFGFETPCREVSDSITWRRFCRIPLEARVPHPTTLMKLTTRCGSAAVQGLNEALLTKATEARVLRSSTLRADTTVVPANVSYPTDSGLSAKAIGRIAATTKRIQAAGGATRTRVRNRSRAAGKRAHAIGAKLRSRSAVGRDEALAAVRRTTGDLADLAELAELAAAEADRLLAKAKRALRRARARASVANGADSANDAAAGRRRGRLARAVNDLEDLLAATWQVAAQTRKRLAGQTPEGSTRRVSLHDSDARPIAKGRLGKPMEFGTKAQLVEGDDGVIVDHNLEAGTLPTGHNSLPQSNGSPSAPAARRARSPPTAATARSASRTTCTTWASRPWSSPERANPQPPAAPPNTSERSARQ